MIFVIIIAVAFTLLIPITVHADLDDLKKLIPDYYDYDEQQSGESDASTVLTAKSESGLIVIMRYTDNNMTWDFFKQVKMQMSFVKEITSFPATCYESWDSNGRSKTIVCIKDDLLITVGTTNGESDSVMKQIVDKMDKRVSLPDIGNSKGGGCLIATATYGSELAPQVQSLREIRDNSLLNTESGTSFMSTFNDFYYSFSPIIADYERENPMFREMVKIAITPMISSLSILNPVDMDSESSVLGYGISLIVLNAMMYVGIPIAGIIVIRKRF